MEFDVTTSLISGIGCLIGIIYLYIKKQYILGKYSDDYSESKWFLAKKSVTVKHSLLFYILLLAGLTVINSFIENRFDLDFIISFLTLNKVGMWVWRAAVSMTYMCIVWSFVIFLILKIKGDNKR